MKISALFIDFDNLFHALRNDDPALAQRFSLRPDSWLDALAKHGQVDDDDLARRLTIRRCYASPHLIQSSRNNLVRAGLELIDMQPLTNGGKNAADIQMVLDIMDSLARYPHIEEYIILSGDSDFVPLLHRLRRDMKWTTVFAPANIAAAYRNCADSTISAEFFRRALDHTAHMSAAGPRPAQRHAEAVRPNGNSPTGNGEAKPSTAVGGGASGKKIDSATTEMAQKLARTLSQQWLGRVPIGTLAAAIQENMGDFVGSNWAGYGSFAKLLPAIGLSNFSIDNSVVTNQILVEDDYKMDFSSWSNTKDGEFGDFAFDILSTSSKKMPFRSPETYSCIFNQLAEYYNDEPQDFADAIKYVTEKCRAKNIDVLPNDIRFIGTGISHQQYKLDRGATPRLLAALWRLNVFELCGSPDWLEDQENASLLVDWFHAPEEDLAAATAEFIKLVSEGGELRA